MKAHNSTAVKLTWPQYSEPDVKNYSILNLSLPNNILVVSNISRNHAGDQSYIVAGLRPFMWYSFRVRAFQFNGSRHVYFGKTTNEIQVRTHEDGKMNENS